MPAESHLDDADGSGLRRDLTDAQEQLRATGEVLTALGRSGSDFDEVFRTVVRSAQRLSRGDAAQLHLFEGASYRLAWYSGLTEEFRAFMVEHPIVADRATLVGRVGLDRRTQQIADVLADPGVRAHGRPAHRPATARSSGRRCCSTTRSSACCRSGAPRSIRSATAPRSS